MYFLQTIFTGELSGLARLRGSLRGQRNWPRKKERDGGRDSCPCVFCPPVGGDNVQVAPWMALKEWPTGMRSEMVIRT